MCIYIYVASLQVSMVERRCCGSNPTQWATPEAAQLSSWIHPPHLGFNTYICHHIC